MKKLILTAFVVMMAVSCVTTGTYENDMAKKQAEINKVNQEKEALDKKYAELMKKSKELLAKNDKTESDLSKLRNDFLDAMKFNDELKEKVKSLGSSVEDLNEKQNTLSAQRQGLESELEKQKSELDELRKMKEIAEKRNAEYAAIMNKLKKMIDAGALTVKIRKGRMIVSLSSDILFASGSAKLTENGNQAIIDLSDTLKDLKDRSFLVIGHSDSTPIKTKRFPSNWELSSQRAIEVVKLMVESGVAPEMLTASGCAEFDPIANNDNDEDKAKNRRVEIVFMPKIEELPGFSMPESK